MCVEVRYTSGSTREQKLEDFAQGCGSLTHVNVFSSIKLMAHWVRLARSKELNEEDVPIKMQAQEIHLPGLMTVLSQVSTFRQRTAIHLLLSLTAFLVGDHCMQRLPLWVFQNCIQSSPHWPDNSALYF